MEQPARVVDVFDNGGVTADRYTIVLAKDKGCDPNAFWEVLCLGDDVTSPQGYSQFSFGDYSPSPLVRNRHLGKEINWSDLPEGHQAHIIGRLN